MVSKGQLTLTWTGVNYQIPRYSCELELEQPCSHQGSVTKSAPVWEGSFHNPTPEECQFMTRQCPSSTVAKFQDTQGGFVWTIYITVHELGKKDIISKSPW